MTKAGQVGGSDGQEVIEAFSATTYIPNVAPTLETA